MNAEQIISLFSELNINIQLKGDNLLVDHKSPLTDDQVQYLKQHKPKLINHLRLVTFELVDIYNRRQCLSCKWWSLDRCNNNHYLGHDAWGETMYYTPDPAQWVRCKYHSMLTSQRQN